MTKLCTLVSGSSGNAVYLSHKGTNVLIDCGISGKQVTACLSDINVEPSDINYILVTHEHTDHTKGVGILSRRYNIPVIASRGTWDGMLIGDIEPKNKIVFNENSQIYIGEIGVTPFDIPHDASQPTGYCFDLGKKRIAVATDIGHINNSIKAAVSGCEVVILEANYDADMLENGPYPYYLKRRIGGQNGHLCNDDTGELATYLVKCGTKKIILGHLSKENNSENIAFGTVARTLEFSGIHVGKDVLMSVAPRYNVSAVIGL